MKIKLNAKAVGKQSEGHNSFDESLEISGFRTENYSVQKVGIPGKRFRSP